MKAAAEEAHGLKNKFHNQKIWWNDEIEELTLQKKRPYQKWLNTKQQEDREKYLDIKRTIRRTAAKREMWDKKCREINTYLDRRN